MKKTLKHLYKKISHRFPRIGFILHRIYHRKIFNNTKRKINGSNNTIHYHNSILSSVTFDIKGSDNKIEIMDDCVLNNVTFHIRGNFHKIVINNRCRFNHGGDIWLEDDHCFLSIGEGATFEDVHLALTEPYSKITIGSDCMFAYDIDIRTGDSHSIISQDNNERINYAKNVTIGNHVWVAAHSILLKGSAIADNSVVATGSIVTKEFHEEGILIGGNPAKRLKQGITWSRERIYKTVSGNNTSMQI
jgi:acetyltransferase-like isoleucine patch superfamily enzyme